MENLTSLLMFDMNKATTKAVYDTLNTYFYKGSELWHSLLRQKIEEMKKFLQENPIDPKYTVPDGWVALDGDIPPAQLASVDATTFYETIG